MSWKAQRDTKGRKFVSEDEEDASAQLACWTIVTYHQQTHGVYLSCMPAIFLVISEHILIGEVIWWVRERLWLSVCNVWTSLSVTGQLPFFLRIASGSWMNLLTSGGLTFGGSGRKSAGSNQLFKTDQNSNQKTSWKGGRGEDVETPRTFRTS